MEMNKGDKIEKVMWLIEGKTIQGQKGPYWAGRFILDKEPIPAKIWQNRNFEEQTRLLIPQKPYTVKATADEYNGVRQLIIQDAKPFEGEFDRSALLPVADSQKETLIEEFDNIIEAMQDDDYKNLLKAFRNSIFFSDFSIAPAAKSIHHAWLSGLLEHSIGLAKAIEALSPLYPELNKDLLIAGAFLHDSGKAREISTDPGFEYTTEGKLFGHIYMGAKMTEELIDSIEKFPEDKKRAIIHLILSHQGQRSDGFGSPVDPSTAEAVFFHHMDNLDAKVRHCLTEIKKADGVSGFILTPPPMKISLYIGDGSTGKRLDKEEDVKKTKPRSGLFAD